MRTKIFLFFAAIFLSTPIFALELPSLSCKVPPPGPNTWKSFCFTSVPGGPASVNVEFRINDAPSNYYIDWGTLGCSSASLTCSTTVTSPFIDDFDVNVIDLDPPSAIWFTQVTVSYMN